ncbi:glyoxalase [Enterococcus sp. 2201sp1_2201st1_B8_2201SCRN_220225]|uniref:glyoxalase n=1 Tax=unclassified Enterococcus TaxID=2608891 RepID=UPI0034A4855C
MATMVFANFPVTDLKKATEFYTKLGFTQNLEYSDERASGMVWDDNFWVMLLSRDYYQEFIGKRQVIDPHSMSGVLVAFSLPSAQAVRDFAQAAADNGGSYYKVESGIPEEVMVGFEVVDLDGNILEPTWMATT